MKIYLSNIVIYNETPILHVCHGNNHMCVLSITEVYLFVFTSLIRSAHLTSSFYDSSAILSSPSAMEFPSCYLNKQTCLSTTNDHYLVTRLLSLIIKDLSVLIWIYSEIMVTTPSFKESLIFFKLLFMLSLFVSTT